MPENVLMSVCYNGDETYVDMLEIPYNTVWTDLEAMVCIFCVTHLELSFISFNHQLIFLDYIKLFLFEKLSCIIKYFL